MSAFRNTTEGFGECPNHNLGIDFGNTQTTALTTYTYLSHQKEIKMENFNVGDYVKVVRKLYNHHGGETAYGKIIRFSSTILINGEPTAVVQYEDTLQKYWHPISGIEKIE